LFFCNLAFSRSTGKIIRSVQRGVSRAQIIVQTPNITSRSYSTCSLSMT